jgi:type IV secretion system protein VirB9
VARRQCTGIFFALALLFAPVANAFALSESRAIATDSRIRTILYHEHEVFKFVGHYGYQSSIEFSHEEEILTISVGDSLAWQITPVSNRLFLKPIEEDADTNMTVLTNKRTYHFELHAKRSDKMNSPDLIFAMRFIYSDMDSNYVKSLSYEESIEDMLRDNPKQFNFNYTLSGEERIAPVRIFDDGKFTYFEFSDHLQDIPAFFQVNSDGTEALINYRMRDKFLVVERVATRFTLRYGSETVCVFNEKLLPGGAAAAGME